MPQPTLVRTTAILAAQLALILTIPCLARANGADTAPATDVALAIYASIEGAEIWIDGELRGTTPSTIELPRGAHDVWVGGPGLIAWSETIRLAGPSIRLRAPVRARPEAPRETPSWSPVSWMAEHMWICASIAVVSFPIIFAPYLRRSLTRRIVLTAVNRQTQTFDLERVSMVPWWRTFLTSKHAATNGAASAASATPAATALSSHSTAATPVEDMSGAALPADWSKRLSEIRIRRMIIRRLVDDASANDDSSLLATRNKKSAERLAATDLFVEKAQAILTERGWTLTTSGVICTAIGVAILVGGASVLQQSADPPDTLSVPAMMVRILKGAAIGGFFLGAAGFVLYLAKAMFHEATQLFSRRHALRFGRLYLYLTDGEIRKFDHMERAFQWTGEFSTAFKDIKYELPRGTLGDVSKVVQKIGEAAKSSRSGAPS